MGDTETRLFHLHYHVPDVGYAERALAENGLPLRARFGSVDDEPVAVRPDEDPPDGFRFRLQDAQRGWANVTLTEGKQLQFDHLGVVTGAFDAVVERAADAGWRVQGVDEPRTFLVTPWGFRIEVHSPDGRVASSLGSYEEGRFEGAVLSVPDPVEADAGLRRVLGAGSGWTYARVRGDRTFRGRLWSGGRSVTGRRSERLPSRPMRRRGPRKTSDPVP